MKINENLVDNNEIDFYFLLAHVTSMSPEELEISSINLEEYGI
jgi:hypothetical protein